jgi:hypothetical protein
MKNVIAIAVILVFLTGGVNSLEAQNKSTTLALGLSVGVPVLGCFAAYKVESPELFLIALAVGPSTGHFYAGQWGTGLLFTGLRTATIAGSIFLAIGVLLQTYDSYDGLLAGGGVLAIGFGVCCVISMVDWMRVPSSIHKYNERLQIKPEIDFKDRRYGVGFVYNF